MVDSVVQHYFKDKNPTIKPIENGRINNTYVIGSGDSHFILQKINSHVFEKPQVVADNFFNITSHLATKRNTHEWFRFASCVKTLSGANYFIDENDDVWRCQTYLHSYTSPKLTAENIQQLGRALAVFHLSLSDFDSSKLDVPLADFHNLPKYLSDYSEIAKEKVFDGVEAFCAEQVRLFKQRGLELHNEIESGRISHLIIHGDPKLDNFVFDQNGKADGLIDLDTVFKGVPHIDLGDSLRSLFTNSGDGLVDLFICENFLRGYLEQSASIFSEHSRKNIFSGMVTMAYELGVRFFADHLAGDIYFKVSRRGDNLKRALTQFKLTQSIVDKEKEISTMAFLL